MSTVDMALEMRSLAEALEFGPAPPAEDVALKLYEWFELLWSGELTSHWDSWDCEDCRLPDKVEDLEALAAALDC